MDPFDRHHHHHHHHPEAYPPPPPPHEIYPPSPPHVHHHHSPPHVHHHHSPPHVHHHHHSPPPPPPGFHHESHHPYPHYEPNPLEFQHEIHHQHLPHLPQPNPPTVIHHHDHEGPSFLSNRPTFRVYSKAEHGTYSLTIRDGRVILARSNPHDMFQHWIKEEKFSTRVKDEEGFPSFALVNKATGQAMKHSIGATHPVQLVHYNPDVLDESILWAESKDLGDGFRTIRMVNNIRLNLDALHGDKNHGGVHDGTIAVLWEWKKGDNQRWKIVPY